jgi:hypothetical protein
MNNTHTPAPWHYRSSAHSKSTFGLSIFHGTAPCEEGLIADLSGRYKSYRTEAEIDPSTIANARLIASAPDLLSALKQIADWEPSASPSEPNGLSIIDAIDIARAAIAKAKGEA